MNRPSPILAQVTFCVQTVFTPVLAKHSKSFSLVDSISFGVDRMHRNFEPMRRQVEARQRCELPVSSASKRAPETVPSTYDFFLMANCSTIRCRAAWVS